MLNDTQVEESRQGSQGSLGESDFCPPPRFRMKCHLCVNYIEMQTDPANCDYVIVSGAQRKEERWDMADNEQVLTTGERRGQL